MSRKVLPNAIVGNEFVVPSSRVRIAASLPLPASVVSLSSVPIESVAHQESIPVSVYSTDVSAPRQLLELMHRYSVAAFAMLFLIVAASATEVGNRYWSAHIINGIKLAASVKVQAPTIAGLNVTVPNDQLAARLESITKQPATLTVGDQAVTISPDVIKSWLDITASPDKSQDYLRIKSNAIADSLSELANQSIKAPVDQVTLTEAGVARVVVSGKNGEMLTDPDGLKQQATDAAKSVMDGAGLTFNAPTTTKAFASVGPEAFDKLIDANVTTKQMYLFEKGQLVKSYPISAGAPATPTILGKYRITSKLASQDMRGYNANGTRYFQPHVHWVSYFSGSYAVHGVYWHPYSWFGAINSSHGCVGLADFEAKWVYDWSPIGTTVITHT